MSLLELQLPKTPRNFRPGAREKPGFDSKTVSQDHPRQVYGEVTGYGSTGPWRNKPGQDLLAQSLAGLPWLNGIADQSPLPMGLSIADLFAGARHTDSITDEFDLSVHRNGIESGR